MRILKTLIILCFPLSITSQELSSEELRELSLDSVYKIAWNNLYDNKDYGFKVARIYVEKAKAANKTDELFRAYKAASWTSKGTTAISYADSLISLAREIDYDEKIAEAYWIKGGKYYLQDKPNLALENLIESYNYAFRSNDYLLMGKAIDIISAIKSLYGEKEEAVFLRREVLKIWKDYKNEIAPNHLISQYDGMARTFARLKQTDSARFYNDKAMHIARDIGEEKDILDFLYLDAKINYYDNNLVKSRDTILKYLYSDGSPFNLADNLIYLGMIEGKLGNPDQELIYYRMLDSVLSTIDYPILDHIEGIYPRLLQDAIEKDNKQLELKYLRRIKYYDSLVEETESLIRSNTLIKFELPLQQRKNESAEYELLKMSRIQFTLIFTTILAVFGAVFFLLRYLKTKRKFSEIMKMEVVSISEDKTIVSQLDQINVPQNITSTVLDQLEQWEKEFGFLEKEIDQNSLAKRLETNSTYLSRIINFYKKQSFSSYLRDLRITYAINQIKENPSLIRTKSMIQIAEQFGFNSTQSFTSAFKSKIGLSPAAFFRQLNKQNL